MATVKCPGCGKDVNDHLVKCPHCGYKIYEHFNKKSTTINSGLSLLIGIVLLILMFVAFFLIVGDSFGTAIFVAGLLAAGALFFILMSFPKGERMDAWKNAMDSNKSPAYKCPQCGQQEGRPISMLSKGASVEVFGLASNKIGKSYKCSNCGYMW